MLLWTLVCIYLYKSVFSFSWDLYPEMELLDHMVGLFLVFWGNSILFSIRAALVYIPTSSMLGFPFLHIFYLLFVALLTVAILTSVKRYHIFILICISMMISDIEQLLKCLLAICITFLEKYLFRSSAHFFNWVVFLMLSCMSCLYMLGINLLLVSICKYFLPFSRLSFHFVNGFPWCTKNFKL